MKRIILSLCLALPLTLAAQTFSFVDSARTTYGSASDYNLTNPVQIVNHTTDSLSMYWERFDVVMPNGWDISSCTPIACQPIGVSSGSYMLDTVNMLSDYHNCHFYPNGIAGSGEAKIRVTNTQTQEEVVVTWYAIADPVGMDEVQMTSILTLGNGGSEVLLQGNFSDLGNLDVAVFDLSGKQADHFQHNTGNTIAIRGYNPGTYIVRLQGANGFNHVQRIVLTH